MERAWVMVSTDPSHDDAASVIRGLLDDPVLRFHGIAYGMEAQERPIHGWGVFVGGSSEYVYIEDQPRGFVSYSLI